MIIEAVKTISAKKPRKAPKNGDSDLIAFQTFDVKLKVGIGILGKKIDINSIQDILNLIYDSTDKLEKI